MQRIPSIALVGRQGAGKDEVGKILNNLFSHQRHAFADPIREILAMVYDLDIERLKYDPVYKETPHPNLAGKTPRFALRHLGTEGFRVIHEDTWVNMIDRRIDYDQPFVITDLRFYSEYSWAKKRGATLVAVLRSEDEKEKLIINDTHGSEAVVPYLVSEAVERGNYITNYTTLSDLELKVTYIVKDLASRVR